MYFGVVDHDVDLAADLAGQLADRAPVGEVERHQRHLRQGSDVVEAGPFLPRLGVADPHDLGPGLHQRLDQRLADLGLAVGDENLAELRVAGHLAQHLVVSHVRCLLRRKSDQHRGAGAVETRADTDARGGLPHRPAAGAGEGRWRGDIRYADARSRSAPRRGARGRAARAGARDRRDRCCGGARSR